MDRIAEQKFNKIQFTGAERHILELMKEGKNFQEIATILGKEASTLFKQMNAIYNKTKNIVFYQSRVRRFLTLQYFLTDPDASASINLTEISEKRFSFDDEPAEDKKEVCETSRNNRLKEELEQTKLLLEGKEHECDSLAKENNELKKQIEKLQTTPPDCVLRILKTKSEQKLNGYLKNCA